MHRLRYLNPFRIRDAVRQIRKASGDGGPKAIRIAGISHPEGLFVPTARVTLELIGRDGRVTRFEPDLPVPFPYAWAYRIARLLHVPLVSNLDPERVKFSVPIPRSPRTDFLGLHALLAPQLLDGGRVAARGDGRRAGPDLVEQAAGELTVVLTDPVVTAGRGEESDADARPLRELRVADRP